MAFSKTFLVQKLPSRPDFLNKFMNECVPEIYNEIYSSHFLAETHFTYYSYKETHCCTVYQLEQEPELNMTELHHLVAAAGSAW
jgi:hypothetical protein